MQRRLLEEFEVPYAILDQNCRLMWMNREFREIAEKEKGYHKSVTGIFPQITKEQVNKACLLYTSSGGSKTASSESGKRAVFTVL